MAQGTTIIPAARAAQMRGALPFWVSLAFAGLVVIAARLGGWALLLPLVSTHWLMSLLDLATGESADNADPDTPVERLFWYRLITLIWAPVQGVLIFGLIHYAVRADHLDTFERVVLFVGLGQVTGAVGIVYAHELMHQRTRLERWLGDILMAMVLYSHFRSEHLLVHHRHVGTPRDPVSARYNENFHRFFPRVLHQCLRSAFRTEAERLARKGRPWWDGANPFWRYWALQAGFVLLAWILGGWSGLGLFVLQAVVAVWYLELTNYVEHYGLTRKYLGNGRYEPVQPHHSWNAAHKASNWLLINLQRHSDHHCKPTRRFPLLQTYAAAQAPQLPFGYPLMVAIALMPPLWRRTMNWRVRKWRAMYYPEITDWEPYKTGRLPAPVPAPRQGASSAASA